MLSANFYFFLRGGFPTHNPKHRGERSLACLPWALDDLLPSRIMIFFFLHFTATLTLQRARIIHTFTMLLWYYNYILAHFI